MAASTRLRRGWAGLVDLLLSPVGVHVKVASVMLFCSYAAFAVGRVLLLSVKAVKGIVVSVVCFIAFVDAPSCCTDSSSTGSCRLCSFLQLAHRLIVDRHGCCAT